MGSNITATKKQRVPALRFPEFSGEWGEKKLGEVILDYKGGAPLKPSDFTEISNFEVIPKKGITRGGKLVLNLEEPTFCKADFYKKNQSSVIDNNYLVTTLRDLVPSGPNIGYIVRFENENKYLLAQGVYGVKIDKDKLNENYLIQYSNTDTYRELMKKIMVGSTQVHIRNTVYFNIDIPYTILSEQQKIADFLSSVDERIRLLKEKKANLEAYKRGVMQQLFSQSLRFKDENGNDYPDWEEKKLGEIAKYYDGTHQTPNYVDRGIPFYSVEHVTSNNFSDTKLVSKEVFEKENERVKLEKGDILMTRIGDIGTARYIDWDINASFYVSLALIKHDDTKYNSQYLAHFINSHFFQLELWQRTIHVAFPKKINLGEIGECFVLLPCLAEQQQIADFLSSIDTRITLCSEQISQAEVYKKGLLQKMFV